MKVEEQVALEITKALMMARPDILDQTNQATIDHYLKQALDLFSRASDLVQARFDPDFFA